jgi:hypothetical protein
MLTLCRSGGVTALKESCFHLGHQCLPVFSKVLNGRHCGVLAAYCSSSRCWQHHTLGPREGHPWLLPVGKGKGQNLWQPQQLFSVSEPKWCLWKNLQVHLLWARTWTFNFFSTLVRYFFHLWRLSVVWASSFKALLSQTNNKPFLFVLFEAATSIVAGGEAILKWVLKQTSLSCCGALV